MACPGENAVSASIPIPIPIPTPIRFDFDTKSPGWNREQPEIDALAFAGPVPDAGKCSRTWRATLEEARRIVDLLPVDETGRCVLGPGAELYRGSAGDEKPVGVVEAKPLGHTLSGVQVQAQRYATGLRTATKLTKARPVTDDRFFGTAHDRIGRYTQPDRNGTH